jgi:hypothetical protein
MRQTDFVPCDCKKCYFCLHGLTGGIEHKRKKKKVMVQYACGTHLRTNNCTVDRCNLTTKSGKKMKDAQYCRMCYRQQEGSGLTTEEKKANCNKSTMGCVQCKEPICASCWARGYDRHQVGNVVN